jgi:2'-5' RNA ligase
VSDRGSTGSPRTETGSPRTGPGATRRLFVALAPPDPVRRRLGAAAEALRQAAGRAAGEVRFTPTESVHLTLQFLGAVPEERVAAVAAAVRDAAAASRPLALEVRGAGGFPSARRARVIWLGVAGDVVPLAALVQDLARRLAPLGFPPEVRPFTPHLTVGRAKDPRGAAGLGGALAAAAEEPGFAWRCGEACLVESHLSPAGARYEVIERAPLGGAAPAP